MRVLQNKTVLYVEDDKTVRNNIKEILGEFFKKVITAGSGEEGWLNYKKNKIDMAIVDIELPGFNGLELIRKIRPEIGYAYCSCLCIYQNGLFIEVLLS